MTNSTLLEAKIKESGKKKTFIASIVGVTIQSFNDKIYNRTQFKASEIMAICDELGITDWSEKEAIFFNKKVANMTTK